jgi:hypothetical protein
MGIPASARAGWGASRNKRAKREDLRIHREDAKARRKPSFLVTAKPKNAFLKVPNREDLRVHRESPGGDPARPNLLNMAGDAKARRKPSFFVRAKPRKKFLKVSNRKDLKIHRESPEGDPARPNQLKGNFLNCLLGFVKIKK